jgi:hypothetical protein
MTSAQCDPARRLLPIELRVGSRDLATAAELAALVSGEVVRRLEAEKGARVRSRRMGIDRTSVRRILSERRGRVHDYGEPTDRMTLPDVSGYMSVRRKNSWTTAWRAGMRTSECEQ